MVRGAAGPALRTEYPEDLHPGLKVNAGEVPGLLIYGPEVAECVKFRPDGLRISLPPTYPRQREGTGVATDFGVKGDFEITVGYEILNEPPPQRDGPNSTELQLVVVPNDYPRPGMWHRTNQNRAILARQTTTLAQVPVRVPVPVPPRDHRGAENAPPLMAVTGHFFADFVRWNNQDVPRDPWGNEQFHRIEVRSPLRSDATAKAGRLRLVRSGPNLSFYTSEDPRQDFTLLQTAEFGTTDLKNVRILASTGWEGRFLDVRVADVRIRAEAFVKAGAEVPWPAPEPRGRWWLTTVLVFSALSMAIAVSLGAWRYTRARRRRVAAAPPAPAPPAPAPAAARAIAFACSGCGKRLQAREEQAGRKLRCPQCQQGVFVPEVRLRKPEDLR
jgi:DNA-directed RNA polymerase subunit RPC12/RpoP